MPEIAVARGAGAATMGAATLFACPSAKALVVVRGAEALASATFAFLRAALLPCPPLRFRFRSVGSA